MPDSNTVPSNGAVPPAKALALLAVATIVCLVPFINKAFHIDDTVYLVVGKQIQAHPLDFYGFQMNWHKTQLPMFVNNKNPPLVSYFIALAAAIVGWSEPALHAVFLLPAIGMIWGTYLLARSCCQQPVSAALVTLTSPVVIVSATSVMSDTLMLCFFVWAVVLWIKAANSNSPLWYVGSALLIAAAGLTKYFGFCLIPLLAAYSIARDRKPTVKLLWLAIPLLVLGAYETWTSSMYGLGHLSDASRHLTIQTAVATFLEAKLFIAMSFLGGSFVGVIFLVPVVCSRRWIVTALLTWAAISAYLMTYKIPNEYFGFSPARTFTVSSAIQMGLFVTAGTVLTGLVTINFRNSRSPESMLIAMWIVGTFCFSGFVNWTCNGRTLLPMAPAVGILVVRCISVLTRPGSSVENGWRWSLIPTAFIALSLGWADTQLADSARTAARDIVAGYQEPGQTIWFQGHWGFQYYMEQLGARPYDFLSMNPSPRDIVVLPQNNTGVEHRVLRPGVINPVCIHEFSACSWVATQKEAVGAGFYASLFGPVPYLFGQFLPERYEIWQYVDPGSVNDSK